MDLVSSGVVRNTSVSERLLERCWNIVGKLLKPFLEQEVLKLSRAHLLSIGKKESPS